MSKQGNTAESITSLTAREAVRLRPAMYIGSVGEFGLHAMLFDILGFLSNDFFEGNGSGLAVRFEGDGSVFVESDWCDIPLGRNANDSRGRTFLEMEATEIFTPGNLNFPPAWNGIAPANFLSEFFEIEVHRDGEIRFLKFEKGIPLSPTENLGSSSQRKTRIRLKPDSEVLAQTRFDFDRTVARLRELACFLPGFTFFAEDLRNGGERKEILKFSGGVADYVSWLSTDLKTLFSKPFFTRIIDSETIFEAAFQFVEGQAGEKTFSLANGYVTEQGGAHVAAFLLGLSKSRVCRKGIDAAGNVNSEFWRQGLVAAISVRVPARELRFEGRTRAKMAGRLSGNIIRQFCEGVDVYFEANPGAAKRLRAHFKQNP